MAWGDKTLREEKKNSIVLLVDSSKFAVKEGKEDDIHNWETIKIFDTYKDANKFLDKRLDAKKKGTFKKKEPLKAIYNRGWRDQSEHSHARITSIDPEGYSCQCRISYGENFENRCKDSHILKDTEENWKLLKEKEELKKKLEETRKALVYWTEEELKEYFENE